ncbi:hypothetical protein Lal_00017108 [Lupinus albus]|uniref:Putative glucan endo-1,3-beta-D-glucosidase n=1 Tax=Lupinus albus TaxID=3870 RepID=A0A6A4QPV2_LUPAL|nr:putative glucan endo-1,3-beta-D-glucosidase [Lupinus albus]KAF1869533.1 hypothetical protein Lal_00017108 [Lupinus albus]
MNHNITLIFQPDHSTFQYHSFKMAKEAFMCLLFFSFLIICCSGTPVDFSYHERDHTAYSTSTLTTFKSQIQFLCFFCAKSNILSKRESLNKVHMRRILDETTKTSATTFPPTNPTSTTPITTLPDSPAIITVPSTNPVTVSPPNPFAMPGTVPSTPPPIPLTPTNPANSQVPVTNPGTAPITVPGTPPATTTNNPPSLGNTNAPTNTPGQGWCVAKTGVPQTTLQSALDYCCGMDSAACSQIQQGGSCYNPNSLQNHASVAFNSYYQKNQAPTSCDFGGAATLINTNPSSGSCIYTSSSASSTTTSSGTGISGSGAPASVVGSQSPPPDADFSHSVGLRPFNGCMVLLISLVTGKLSMRQ